MILSLFKIFIITVGLILFLLLIKSWGKKFKWQPEWQRKIVHTGFGLMALSFPWVFSQTWEVFMVCSISILFLLFVRNIRKLKKSIGKSIYSVHRFSYGELFFGLSILLLFSMSKNNRVLYILPLAVLTFSDAVAALVGTHYGKKIFKIAKNTKSWEGTAAFSGITFILMILFLYGLTSLTWPALLLIAATFSILGALIEAVSWNGLDNIFIPMSAYLFLNAFLHQEEFQLFFQFISLLGLSFLGLIAGPKSRLNTHALMVAIIALYFFCVVGGTAWVIAPVLVFLSHIALVKIYKDEHNYTLDSVLSVFSGGFFWILMEKVFQLPYGLFFFAFSLAIHLQIIVLLRLKELNGEKANSKTILLTSLLSSGMVLITTWIYFDINRQLLILTAFAILLMFIGGIIFSINAERFSQKRWLAEAALAISGSILGLIPFYIMESI